MSKKIKLNTKLNVNSRTISPHNSDNVNIKVNASTKCLLINIRSVNNKIYKLTELLLEQSVDICCMTETWLREHSEPAIADLKREGYNVINVPRKNKRGGGVAFLYTENKYNAKKVKTDKYEFFELLEIVLLGKIDIIRFSIIYRTGYLVIENKDSFLNELHFYLDSLITKEGINIVLGDFNIRQDNNKSLSKDFFQIMDSRGFNQVIKEPTHIDGGILDLLFIPNSFSISDLKILDDQTLSDHYPITFNIPLITNPLPTHFTKCYRNINTINTELFRTNIKRDIGDIVKYNIVETNQLDQSLIELDQYLLSEIDRQAPLITKTTRITTQIIKTPKIQEARRIKRRAEHKYKKSKTQANRDHLKTTRKNLATIVQQSRTEYFKDKLDKHKNDVRKTYNIVNSLLNKNNDKIFPTHINKKTLANKFAFFYKDKIDKIQNSFNCTSHNFTFSTAPYTHTLSDKFQQFVSIDEKQLLILIKNLDSNKQSLLDPLPCKLFKDFKLELVPVLTKLINCSFNLGYFPSHLKTAVVTPIIKSKNLDCEILTNYRPVSNLTLISKLIEKCALEQLSKHLIKNNLYCKFQSAYRPGHSCETALVKIYNDINNSLNSDTYVILILLDFSAAFDTIDHNILINRLNTNYGIQGKALNWFSSYLTGRTYKVKINNTISDPMPLNYGVPQGSILGPILFSLYIKEIQEIIHSHNINSHFYADDIQLYMKCTKDTDFTNLENCLNRIISWTNKNFLKLNNNKTQFMAISTKNYTSHKIQHLTLMGETFKVESSVKSLGFILDDNLQMDKQINHVCSVGYYMLRNLWKISKKVIDKALRTQLVHASVLSRINYCNALYTFLPKTQTRKLQKLINSSARFIFNITGRKRFEHITPYLKQLHFLPIDYRIEFKICLLIYKCLYTDNAPTYLTELINTKTPNLHWNLRTDLDRSLLAHNQIVKQNYKTRGFSHAAPIIWNRLPSNIRTAETVDTFKNVLKTYYFKKWNNLF